MQKILPKVLVLFCGGTIIMQKNADGALVAPDKDKAIEVLLGLEPRINEIARIDLAYIDNIDSTNMNPGHWDRISSVIAHRYQDYDGFVITHGTNTMAYTASALSFSLQNIGKPVVLTGAQIPGDLIHTDARRNFVNAVRVAVEDLAGVYLVFDEEIILGARSSKVSESKLDAFETINWDLAGEIRINIRLNDELPGRDTSKQLAFQPGFEPNIAVCNVFPGLNLAFLYSLLHQGIKGLVLSCFGPGDLGYEYVDLIKRAHSKQIPVVITTQCLEGSTLMHINDVGNQALAAGAIQAYDMSIETVTTKLMWALKHCAYGDVAKAMQANLVGEINREGKIY